MRECTLQRLRRALIPLVAALQVRLVGGRADGAYYSEAFGGVRAYGHSHCERECAHGVHLQGQHIAGVALERFRPEYAAAVRLDQSELNGDAFVSTAHAAIYNHVRT